MRNNAKNTPGRPFQKGNPGRPRGARNKATVAAEALLDGEAEKLARKAVDLALEGNMAALRICLERVVPPRKERPIELALPTLEDTADMVAATAAILAAVSEGRITPGEGKELTGMIDVLRRAIETEDLERRVAALERSGARK